MKHIAFRRTLYSLALGFVLTLGLSAGVTALGSTQNPQSGSTGLQGTISNPAPTTGATIGLPVNGQTFTSTPITVAGSCPSGLLVKLFSNNIFVGAAQCTNGSFSLQIDLFSGENDLIARVYDALDQAGPDSNTVRVTFQDAQFLQFGSHVSLTSNYAKLGANPGANLNWPLVLSGGTGPYAISADWGDGSGNSLKSVAFIGGFDITHVYKSAGIYNVIIKATDVNGTSAFLQLVGVANGKVTQADGSIAGNTTTIKKVLVLWPFIIIFPLALIAFWLGRRYELLSLHRQLEKQTNAYDEENR
ncbi:MAG: hypothetical protein WC498_00385 [Candidatus Saccharimonadales bacterium]